MSEGVGILWDYWKIKQEENLGVSRQLEEFGMGFVING